MQRILIASFCLLPLAALLSSCATDTLIEAPRVEQITLHGEMAEPCLRPSAALPNPDTATWQDLTLYAIEATQRGEACADKVGAIQKAVAQ